MKVPFLDLKAQYHSIKKEIDDAVIGVFESTSFVLGKTVSDFEKRFADIHGVKHCVGVSSGTDGNHMALWALGVGPGDDVIVPANTFIATAWGATLCGAKPVFVDCHPESYNIDPEKVGPVITPRTKAIVAVHLYGQSADMDGISSQLSIMNFEVSEPGVFVNRKSGQKIFLVEDCAQSHIAEYNKKKVGGLSKASSFSFYPGKNLGAYGEAGAVATNDDDLARKFRMLRDHGAEEKYVHKSFGHNYRMEAVQGAVLGVKLGYLQSWTEARRKVAARYSDLLSDISEVVVPAEMPYAKHVYHLFVLRLNSRAPLIAKSGAEVRNDLQKFLNEREIATGLHYPLPLHLQPCFAHLGYRHGEFPVTEQLAELGLSLPMYPELSVEQTKYVSDTIHEFFTNRKSS
ncbi:MAG TPA: DegT/DnrJ/EryC1/StrS family aminotransferase [Candidatus Kryptonia bacterium]